MPSPEGEGKARSNWKRAWDAYARTVNRAAGPALEPVVRPVARELTFELMGFWLAWHLEGGFEGLQDRNKLGMSRSAVYRRVTMFRRMTGVHPDEFTIPGVELSVEDYLRGARASAEPSPQPAGES
jgi:hypothetical protein